MAGVIRPQSSEFSSALVSDDVKNCILSTAAVGDTVDNCLDGFLSNLGKKKEDYFLYESMAGTSTTTGSSSTFNTNSETESMYIDSCEVYTGPASTLPHPNDFENCIEETGEKCSIPSFVWTGRSSGKTPVASFHSWKDNSNLDGSSGRSVREERAIAELNKISLEIVDKIKQVNRTFQQDGIEVQLFSAEGDALHQLMDCMFMGPYARMDYGSRGVRNNLPVPSWSRAETETEAETRAFTACTSDKVKGDYETPFTCGSPARRSVIKYFVRDFAQDRTISGLCGKPDPNITVQEKNRDVLVKIVQSRLTNLYNVWSDTNRLSCQGKDTDGNFIDSFGIDQCDKDDSSTWTPVQIRNWDHATSAQVAEELFASASCFHERAMHDAQVWFKNIHNDERERYYWSKNDANSFAARESSLFHKHKPVISYGYDELDEPMHNGTVSMWEMCAGLLGHVHFTIPLAKNSLGQYVPTTLQSPTSSYSPYTPSTTPNLTALENFILQVSADAFQVSPFYRHYGMFHLPSNSAGCPDFAAQASLGNKVPAGSKYTLRQEPELGHGNSSLLNLTVHGVLDELPKIHRRGVMYGLLGAASRHRCFCDFERVPENETNPRVTCESETCQIPSMILQDILTMQMPITDDMNFLKTTIASVQGGQFCMDQNEIVQRTLKFLWVPGAWPCPELDVSDQWGVVRDSSAWIQSEEGDEINVNDLLEMGSGGLRPGTIHQVLDEAKRKITPVGREGTMNSHDGSPITGQTRCEMHRDSMRPESLAGHFVNDLFPSAQGVVDSPAVSHCMRFAIEIARLNVIAIVTGTNSTRESIIARLSSTANSWKQRCAAQIDLLSMCVMTKALDSRNGVYSSGNPTHCAFTLSSTDNVNGGVYRTQLAYITPGCLVYVFGNNEEPPTLHDPCMFYDCNDIPDTTVNKKIVLDVQEDIVRQPLTKVLFNPVDMVDPFEVRGTWAAKKPANSKYTDEEYDAHLVKVKEWHDDLARDLPGRITDTSLFRRALIDEEATGVGSPNTWSGSDTPSKPLATSTEDNTKYCDMMVDWWPGHFDYPVAYHPTTPCHKDETAFRTFDRSFTYDPINHTMLYEPLAMRDMDHVHTHFGAEGLCRTSNVGLDMQVCLFLYPIFSFLCTLTCADLNLTPHLGARRRSTQREFALDYQLDSAQTRLYRQRLGNRRQQEKTQYTLRNSVQPVLVMYPGRFLEMTKLPSLENRGGGRPIQLEEFPFTEEDLHPPTLQNLRNTKSCRATMTRMDLETPAHMWIFHLNASLILTATVCTDATLWVTFV